MSGKTLSVPIYELRVDDQKHRTKLDEDIKALAESIRTTHQINPITVVKEGSEYRVIAGRRRYAALSYIQEELEPEKTIKALVHVTDVPGLQQELIKIDENIQRKQLKDAEFDEAIYRRKQIYEEIHPESKQGVAGAAARHANAKGRDRPGGAFSKDAAKKLGTNKRTIERAVARASKATDKVKQARASGALSPSKVDLLVTLPAHEQDLLLPIAKKKDVKELKSVIETAKKRGAKAAAIIEAETRQEDPRLKPIIRAIEKLTENIQDALENRLAFEGESRHESLKAVGELIKRLDKFADFQRSALGYVRVISRKDGEKKLIRARV